MAQPPTFCRDTARRLIDGGSSYAATGRRFGVSGAAVWLALNGRPSRPRKTPKGTWPHEWCPPQHLDDYRTLSTHMRAAEARALIEARVARTASRTA